MILDLCDMIIILATLGLEVLIIDEERKQNCLSLNSGLGLICMSVIWCWKQSFFPMALVPIGAGLLLFKLLETMIVARKGYHSWLSFSGIVLFLNASCYIIVANLLFFLLFCIIFVVAIRLLRSSLFTNFFWSQYVHDLPFSAAIVLAQWITFLNYFWNT